MVKVQVGTASVGKIPHDNSGLMKVVHVHLESFGYDDRLDRLHNMCTVLWAGHHTHFPSPGYLYIWNSANMMKKKPAK